MIADRTRVGGMAVAGRDGIVVCSTNPATRGLSVADREYFQQALAQLPGADADPIVMSPLTLSRATNKPAVFIAAPLQAGPGSAGTPGVILAGLDLAWFARLSGEAAGVPSRLIQVLDSRDGALLARSPDPNFRVGQRYPAHPVIHAFRSAPQGGTVTAVDLDGVDRIFGFAPLPGRAAGLVVAVGLAEADVRAGANRRVLVSVRIAATAAAFAVAVAWFIAKTTLLRPIGALVAAVGLVAAGDLTARASMGRGAAQELRNLGAAFARMARRLKARDERITQMQHEIAVSEGQHRILSENANDMITRFSPDFTRLYVSPACRDLLGYAPEELVGTRPGGLVLPEDWPALDTALNQRLLAGAATARAMYRAVHKDGRTVWIESSGRRLEDGSGYVVVSRDVSERKELEAQLEEANRQLRILAREDGLTRLANRRRFDEVMGEEYRRAMRVRSSLALLLLDVDRFKAFNDTYGHPSGDACLQTLASVINGLARRPADLPARYGGEEFVVLLPDTDAAGALILAECIRAAVRDLAIPHTRSDTGVVTVSVGVAAMIPFAAGLGPAALIEAADAALYEAKHAGRDTVRLASAQAISQAR
ncbi:MAG: diguanylate cyclase [Gemmatimonadaceae bacterium]|nr:diguanylate cyclase [Acetobacteraceae bacterium]